MGPDAMLELAQRAPEDSSRRSLLVEPAVKVRLPQPAEAAYPKLMAWVEIIAARPAVGRALAAVDDVRTKTTQFDKAGAEAMDHLFGRGRHATAA